MKGVVSSIMVVLLLAGVASAATYYWDGTSGSWSAASGWSTSASAATPDLAAAPGSGDVAVFNIDTLFSAQNVSLDADQAVSNYGANFRLGGCDWPGVWDKAQWPAIRDTDVKRPSSVTYACKAGASRSPRNCTTLRCGCSRCRCAQTPAVIMGRARPARGQACSQRSSCCS